MFFPWRCQVAGAKNIWEFLCSHLWINTLDFLRIGIPWDSSPWKSQPWMGEYVVFLFQAWESRKSKIQIASNMAAFWRLRWVAKFPAVVTIVYWLVVSKIFYFHPYLGKIPNLTIFFQRGWKHQQDISWLAFVFEKLIFVTSLTVVSHWFVFWHPFEATKNRFSWALWGINKTHCDLEIMFDSNLEKGNSVAKHFFWYSKRLSRWMTRRNSEDDATENSGWTSSRCWAEIVLMLVYLTEYILHVEHRTSKWWFPKAGIFSKGQLFSVKHVKLWRGGAGVACFFWRRWRLSSKAIAVEVV